MWRIFWLVIGLFALYSPTSWAQTGSDHSEAQSEEPRNWDRYGEDYRVGLLSPASASPESEVVAQRLRELLRESGGTLVPISSGVFLGSEINSPEAEEIKNEGERLYFYEGPDAARDFLLVELKGRVDVSRRWMSDVREASAFFESIIYLVRAHLDLSESEEASVWMKRGVEAFPAHRPDEDQFPPLVHELWGQVKADLASDDAVLQFSAMERREQCSIYLNGGVVRGAEIALVADRSYLLGHQCAEDEGPRYDWVSVSVGEQRDFIIVDQETSDEEMKYRLEQAMREGRLDGVVYLGPGACGAEGEPEKRCVATLGRSQWQRFSMRAVQEPDAEEVWTEVGPRSQAVEEIEMPPRAKRAMAAGVGGVILLAGGVAWLAMTKRRARAFGCSATTSASVSGEACQAVEPRDFYNDEERGQYARSLSWHRLAASMTMAVGLSLSIGSVVGFVERNRQIELQASSQGVSLRVRY